MTETPGRVEKLKGRTTRRPKRRAKRRRLGLNRHELNARTATSPPSKAPAWLKWFLNNPDPDTPKDMPMTLHNERQAYRSRYGNHSERSFR